MQTNPNSWVDVDLNGLSKLMVDKHPRFALLELIQNGLDANGVRNITIDIEYVGDGRANLTVVDDSPEGFHDLSHAYTLFAESEKKGDPTKRGRFNMGEKMVLAICDQASVISTTGGVEFHADGTRREIDVKRDFGSCFAGTIRMTEAQVVETIEAIEQVILPSDVKVMLNGFALNYRTPILTFDVVLPTMRETEDGFRKTDRKTTVAVYEPHPGAKARIYELGIPVVETGDRYDVDVAQKVPLNMDRDNVTPAFLRRVRAFVLNETVSRLDQEEASATWAKDALADDKTTPETAAALVTARFGEKAVRYDPSDPEANKIAASKGYTVVPGGTFTGAEWGKVNAADVLPRAGIVTPSPGLAFSADGEDTSIPEAEWTEGMHAIAAYAKRLAARLLLAEIDVKVHRLPFGKNILAAYGPRGRERGNLTLNLTKLGHAWFNNVDQISVDELLIHEFAHHTESDHFSHKFLDAACALGAKMRHVDFTVANCRETAGRF